jgi:P-type Ca2+ transporter type 2C
MHNKGLTNAEATRRLSEYGPNRLEGKPNTLWLDVLKDIAQEPMFILLAVACLLYFFLGDLTEALMMLVSIAFVAGIEIFQEGKSKKALEALRQYTKVKVRVLRDGVWEEMDSEVLVPGDVLELAEGDRIPVDGVLLSQNDLAADESVLTGESLPVEKNAYKKPIPEDATSISPEFLLYQGTTIASGQGLLLTLATGARTEFGKLGRSIESIDTSETPLQIQIKRFVRAMGVFGLLAFVLVFSLNIWQAHDFWKALLFSLTVVMALIPEEIPVAFTTFMGLGAYRMAKHGILAKQPKTVESLGSATVICLDKTGTITENKMTVAEVLDFSGSGRVLAYAWWASEPKPVDMMERAIEKAIHTIESEKKMTVRKDWRLIHEYALSGRPPMMTHIWESAHGKRIVASKGAIERIIEACGLSPDVGHSIVQKAEAFAAKGYRVLGVASAETDRETAFPSDQQAFDWRFEGMVAFYDPPKKNVNQVLQEFYDAGIRVMMLTGDHPATAKNIARATGLRGWESAMTGQEVMELDEPSLKDAAKRVNVFARMFPEAKLKIIETLKAEGDTVAMSGDGVNDGPALKSAQIGVAMGITGTEIAKTAASLVLLTDDLKGMATAVRMGRRIYNNLRKAIGYVISIHLPIVVLVIVPLLLSWPYPHILLPLHVIFLELVMDPIAAIAFENEPAEHNAMQKPPRKANASLFSWRELGFSILIGSTIAIAVLVMYQYAVQLGLPEETVRSFVFVTLVSANLFLALAYRSFDYTFIHTLRYKNRSMPLILAISVLMLLSVTYLPPVAGLFRMSPLSAYHFMLCCIAGLLSILWFEVWKAAKRAFI